jgi:hypothetical protein
VCRPLGQAEDLAQIFDAVDSGLGQMCSRGEQELVDAVRPGAGQSSL